MSALYVFDPGSGGLAWRHQLDYRGARARHPPTAHRPGRAADRCSPARPISSCRAHRTWRRKRPIRTGRGGSREPPAPSRRPARRWKTGRFSSTSACALGVPFEYSTRRARARRYRRAVSPACRRSRVITTLSFNRPVPARHWLQKSNPSERWKWDFMFQDLPPVKGNVDPTSLPAAAGVDPAQRSEVTGTNHTTEDTETTEITDFVVQSVSCPLFVLCPPCWRSARCDAAVARMRSFAGHALKSRRSIETRRRRRRARRCACRAEGLAAGRASHPVRQATRPDAHSHGPHRRCARRASPSDEIVFPACDRLQAGTDRTSRSRYSSACSPSACS